MTKFKDIIFEEDVAVHCPEEWMANELLKYEDSKGRRWQFKNKHLKDAFWNVYQENTAYQMPLVVFSHIDEFKRRGFKILHYNDVVIKEGEEMETRLDYELFIKGRRAEIGSELWDRYGNKTIIIRVIINKEGEISIRCLKVDKSTTEQVKLSDVDNFLFWEKPTIYQLPDTEGNLSEVKIGQQVWVRSNDERIWGAKVIENKDDYDQCRVDNDYIVVKYDTGHKTHFTNITGKNHNGELSITTNKPSRFHGKQDWSQAPERVMWWAMDKRGYAYWFEEKPETSNCEWIAPNTNLKCAGYRNDLIDDKENMKVLDWKDSLVMRPKGE